MSMPKIFIFRQFNKSTYYDAIFLAFFQGLDKPV